jgi:hypothetical protein
MRHERLRAPKALEMDRKQIPQFDNTQTFSEWTAYVLWG